MERYEPKLGMKSLFKPCTNKVITAFEQGIDATLPDDFRAFLLQWNGCRFAGAPAFGLMGRGYDREYGTVRRLFGLPAKPDGANLRTSGIGYEFAERVPERFLAIGDNPYVEAICISLSGKDRGNVFLWSPGETCEPNENVRTTQYLHLAARTFREFFDAIRQNPNPLYQ